MPHRIKYADPRRAGRHPFQTFLLALCGVSGFPLAFGHVHNQSTNSVPPWLAVTWGVALVIGSIMGLTGAYWPLHRYQNGLTLEAIGMVVIVPVATIYAFSVFVYSGFNGVVGTCVIFGFGLACAVRARDIYRVLAKARRELGTRKDRE